MTPPRTTRRRSLLSPPGTRTVSAALAFTIAAAVAGGSVAATLAAPPVAAAAVPFEPGDVAYTEDFDSVADGALPEGWDAVTGEWAVADGRLVGEPSSIGRITFGPHLENYRFEATVRFDQVNNAGRWMAPILDISPDGSVPWWQAAMRSQTTASNGIELATRTAANSWSVPYTASAPTDAGVGNDVEIAIEVQGNDATWIFDGQEVLEGRIDRSDDGVLGFAADGARVSIDDVVVTELAPRPVVNDDGELPATAAHRGYSSVTPENSLAAYAAAMKTGAEYVEIDVHTTADGVPVVMHDQTVDRTTNGTGDVALLDVGYLAGLEAGSFFSPAFAEQPVPTFADVLDLMGTGSSDLLLEIKGPETREEVDRVIDMILDAGVEDRVVLQSFDENALRYAHDKAPQIPLGLLRGSLDADPVATAEALHATYYNPSAGALRTRPSVVQDLNAAGVGVFVWTVDSAADWAELAELGVEGVITNRAGEHVGWTAAREQAGDRPEEPKAHGLLAALAGLDLSTGQAQQLFSALHGEDWDRLARVVTKHVDDAEQRDALLAEIEALRS
ncbi:glycerophosphodiester phosphodiesterase family protein [Isoptericola sp. BMS4]|uniref:glycerophosphodiester phosphodiesterase family protein n=1 Tax=Isoptericola sp. BMS4 TaxID=2527875 RepID=UPI0014234379|nr:glycerophosphodiester phosphodiesterase family protein [Isoptericola sp. BMS4]